MSDYTSARDAIERARPLLSAHLSALVSSLVNVCLPQNTTISGRLYSRTPGVYEIDISIPNRGHQSFLFREEHVSSISGTVITINPY